MRARQNLLQFNIFLLVDDETRMSEMETLTFNSLIKYERRFNVN